jgi:hypothetical protein
VFVRPQSVRLLHPFGESSKSVKNYAQSSLWRGSGGSTAGNRINKAAIEALDGYFLRLL